MVALQASIGALNDLVDAPRDAGHKPGKPIPAGLVSAGSARAVAVVAAAAGLALSLRSGPAVVLLAGIVLGIGYGYDLVLKGTAWSWVPFAVGIPLLPVYAWLGTTGSLPASFEVLLPVAVVAGAALAIANARVDMERDAAAGVQSVALRLGSRRAWAIHAALLAIVVAAALATLAGVDTDPKIVTATAGAGFVIAVGALVGCDGGSARRERAWELEAVGVGLLAATWLAGAAGPTTGS
jgi:geranylgeranylglycerol-phosphate geranylgeranyltransferase